MFECALHVCHKEDVTVNHRAAVFDYGISGRTRPKSNAIIEIIKTKKIQGYKRISCREDHSLLIAFQSKCSTMNADTVQRHQFDQV